jgi:hypothetical protein
MGDRGYARGRGLRHVVEQGGDFVVRSGLTHEGLRSYAWG